MKKLSKDQVETFLEGCCGEADPGPQPRPISNSVYGALDWMVEEDSEAAEEPVE